MIDLRELAESDPDTAERYCVEALNKDPDNALILFTLGQIYMNTERYGVARPIQELVTRLVPERAASWNNLGMCWAGLGNNAKARESFREADKRDKRGALYKANLAMTYFADRDFKTALKYADASLKIDPQCKSARNTKGLSLLSTGQWQEAWDFYGASVGSKFRKQKQFAGEPLWNGEPGKRVVFYGEQGLGDEMMYASCLPDMRDKCAQVILECDSRLVHLFRRSFPWAKVHGTRLQPSTWVAGEKIDASLPVGQMPQFCRPTPESCPGTPYLVADPERRTQWRALFDSWGTKPKIGICWSGGSKHNKPKEREIGLENLRPLIEAIDADWISLQYRDPTQEIETTGLPVRHYRRACETEDYDDTAALVAELDCVIGVHTSVHHLAGALGVPGIVLVPSQTIWIYELVRMHWYRSASLFKQNPGETWRQTIERLCGSADLRRIRRQGNGGVSHLLSIGHQDRYLPCSVPSAGLAAAA